MKLRERQYRSKFDRRHNQQSQRHIIPEYEREPIDLRRIMFKWGPWVIAAAVAYSLLEYFVI